MIKLDLKNYINTYIDLLAKCGFILDIEKYYVSKKINDINIVIDDKLKFPYYYDNKNTIYINNNLCSDLSSWNIDEFIFEGFTSYLNSFHKTLFGNEKENINKLIRSNISNDLYENFYKNDKFINGLNLQNGIFMMDKFVSQFVAQKLVEEKYSNSDYINEIKDKYSLRTFTFYSSEPNVILKTKFNNNYIIYSFALKIINDYFKNDMFSFAKESLSKDFLKNKINGFKGSIKLPYFYRDLCYAGVIEKNYLYDSGLVNSSYNDDISLDPENLFLVIKQLLNGNFFIASDIIKNKNAM